MRYEIEFIEGEVSNLDADYLFSTHCFEEFLARHRDQLFESERRHGKVDVDRYWIEPLSVTMAPVEALKQTCSGFTWFEVRLLASGPDILWHMSPTPVLDRVPADQDPTTWDARMGSNPFMPLGKIRGDGISIFGRSEEDIQRSLSAMDEVVSWMSVRLISVMDQIELHFASKRFATSGALPTYY